MTSVRYVSTPQLIEMVTEYPILYNMDHADYKNTRKKKKVWQELGVGVGVTGEELKKKWKNVRDSYVKHLRSVKSGDKRCKSWPWVKLMEPVAPYLTIERRCALHSEIKLEDDSLSSNHTASISELSNHSQDNLQLSPTLPITPVAVNDIKTLNTNNVHKWIAKGNADGDTDATELIFLGYAKTVKGFSLRRQATTKLKIAQIIMEAELEEQDEYANS